MVDVWIEVPSPRIVSVEAEEVRIGQIARPLTRFGTADAGAGRESENLEVVDHRAGQRGRKRQAIGQADGGRLSGFRRFRNLVAKTSSCTHGIVLDAP